MRKLTGIFSVVCLVTMLTGCMGGSEDTGIANILTIQKNGEVTETITEDFDKAYYAEEDLKEFVLEEIAAYNRTKEKDSIQIDKLTVENNKVMMKLTYKTSEDYQNFTSYTMFHGSVAEAYNAGYNLNVTLQSTTESPSIGRNELLEMGDNRIIITDAVLDIKVSDNILYISDNVSLRDDKQVTIGGEGLAYIIY
ncbi:MAG: hypothetical protein IJ485_06700 [Lachnospiraceae bacterium]|nr:hypothetical protein [Lachnospiraceae bacterium]